MSEINKLSELKQQNNIIINNEDLLEESVAVKSTLKNAYKNCKTQKEIEWLDSQILKQLNISMENRLYQIQNKKKNI